MSKVLERHEVPENLKWRLEDIYATDQEFEADLAKAKDSIAEVRELRGTINSSASLLHVLERSDELGRLVDRLVAYSYMRRDEDNSNSKYQAYADQALSTAIMVGSAFSFLEPEILSIDEEVVWKWVEEEPRLSIYRHPLHNILRMKAHTLPAEQEELLAEAGEMASAPGTIFNMFNDADLKFPEITNENGEKVELTHGRYIQFLESKDRRVREEAFTALYNTYKNWKNTLGTMYTSELKQAKFFAKTRKYDSALERALDSDNVKPEVYHNLIGTIHDHLGLLHKYVNLRKKLLGLDELHMYDLYVPMVADEDVKIPREKAIELVQEGLKALGDEYLQDLNQSFTDGWIDWLENRGKTSGAYSWGTYGVHPYVLMNYQDNLDNMFTLAHELGHAMHSYYSHKNQPYVTADYTIFVAEVASTVNETLVMRYLLEQTTDKKRRMYLLNHFLEQFRGTVFRQTMFAEFELLVHDRVGKGESLTADQLSEIYYDLNKKYYGDGIVVDELIELEWARIPHFYRPFYVYKYATGFSAAVALSEQILTEGEPARERYLQFLGSGGSDYPLELLKRAGVDMTSPEPIASAMQVFGELLAELEQLSKEQL